MLPVPMAASTATAIRSTPRALSWRPLWGLAALCGVAGCTGELALVSAVFFGLSLGAWIAGRDRHRRALEAARGMRLALASGQHRHIESLLRRELLLVEAGEAVSEEREWLARAQLGGLLVAEWRLDEAAEVYGTDRPARHPALRGLAAFGRHELSVLTETPDPGRLDEIRRDRDETLRHVPAPIREDVGRAWHALEGLCLVRMGRVREGLPLLEEGLASLEYSPSRVVYLYHLAQAYEHVGERDLARRTYEETARTFPGTRLASEAKARTHALGPAAPASVFRGMLPEAPEPDRIAGRGGEAGDGADGPDEAA